MPDYYFSPFTIFPFPGGSINEAKEFKCGDGLGIQVHPYWFLTHQGIRLVQGAQDLALAGACVADDKDGVPDMA